MTSIKGWNFERDAKGFWCVSGALRHGPWPRPDQARAYAHMHSAPKRNVTVGKPQRTARAEAVDSDN